MSHDLALTTFWLPVICSATLVAVSVLLYSSGRKSRKVLEELSRELAKLRESASKNGGDVAPYPNHFFEVEKRFTVICELLDRQADSIAAAVDTLNEYHKALERIGESESFKNVHSFNDLIDNALVVPTSRRIERIFRDIGLRVDGSIQQINNRR